MLSPVTYMGGRTSTRVHMYRNICNFKVSEVYCVVMLDLVKSSGTTAPYLVYIYLIHLKIRYHLTVFVTFKQRSPSLHSFCMTYKRTGPSGCT